MICLVVLPQTAFPVNICNVVPLRRGLTIVLEYWGGNNLYERTGQRFRGSARCCERRVEAAGNREAIAEEGAGRAGRLRPGRPGGGWCFCLACRGWVWAPFACDRAFL